MVMIIVLIWSGIGHLGELHPNINLKINENNSHCHAPGSHHVAELVRHHIAGEAGQMLLPVDVETAEDALHAFSGNFFESLLSNTTY